MQVVTFLRVIISAFRVFPLVKVALADTPKNTIMILVAQQHRVRFLSWKLLPEKNMELPRHFSVKLYRRNFFRQPRCFRSNNERAITAFRRLH